MQTGSRSRRGVAAYLVAIACTVPALAQDVAPPSGWAFAIEPYLWLAGVDGTLKYDVPPGGGGGAEVGLTIEDLSLAFMLNGEARKGKWSVIADFAYVDIDSSSSEVTSVRFAGPGGRVEAVVEVDAGGGTSITATEVALAGGTTVARGSASWLDVIAGVRYFTLEGSTSWVLESEVTGPGPGQTFARSGTVSKRAELWDGIVGLRGALGLGEGRWTVPVYVDIGAGSGALTWQVVAGLAYRFSWGDLHLAYRHLAYDMGDDELLQDFSVSGAAAGARFRF
jgi:hypothetical protein